MPEEDVPRRHFRDESAESFSSYRKLILRELERLDKQLMNQSELLNTIRIEMVRLAEGIEANSKELNESKSDIKLSAMEINKIAVVEERVKKNESRLDRNEKRLDGIGSETKISGAATGAGGGVAAAALAELIKFLMGGA